jgi:pimeloyl-ACP methyl ester carboxylesterase
MTPDAWRAQGDVFDWRGEPIFFRAEGRGEPVVLIHGVPTASWDWAPLGRRWSSVARAVLERLARAT